MRVLEVTNTYPPADISGVGALVFELCAALAQAGHQPIVLTRAAAEGDRFAVPTRGPKVLFPLLAVWRWASLARGQDFDRIHLHESDGALVALAVRLARLFHARAGRARLVATLQVSYRRERLAVRAVRDEHGRVLSRPTAAEHVFGYLRAPILSLAGRLTARLADVVVAPSQATARELEDDYGARVAAVVPNGVLPVEDLEPSGATAAAARPPVLLYAGRLRTRKAVAVLIEAMVEVVRHVPAATLVVAGSGEQRPALEQQVQRLGLGERIRFAGAVPRAAMAPLYAGARVFCLPSTYEGFPLAILEAMAHGLPVVSTRVAGIPEAVEDGVTGLLVAPESPTALAHALVRLLADPVRGRQMGEAGRARLGREFSRARVTHEYLRVFEMPARAHD